MVYGRKRYTKKRFTKRRSYGRRRTSKYKPARNFKRLANRVLKTASETKSVESSLVSSAGAITSTWSVYALQVPTLDTAASSGIVGRSYYPGGVSFFNAILRGGQATSVVADDQYNVIRVVLFESDATLNGTSLETWGVELDTPFTNKTAQAKFPVSHLKVYYDKLITMVPSHVAGSELDNLLPNLRRMSLNVRFKGKNYISPGNAVNTYNRKFYIAFLSDSTVTPHPGFIQGTLRQWYKDDS